MFDEDDDANTPLTVEEREQLIPSYITLRRELNEAEQINGRFSRMVGDTLVRQLGRPRFSWGSASLIDPGQTRACYIAALRAADAHDIGLLLAFARS